MNINKRNREKFLNRSQVIDAVLFQKRFRKYPAEKVMQGNKEEMKTVSFSISEDGLDKLKRYKQKHNVTPSIMIDSMVRHEVNVISKVAEYCEVVIVGVSGKNYLVSIDKLNSLKGITKEAKETVANYSETIEYNNELFVLVPYDFIFRNLYKGYI